VAGMPNATCLTALNAIVDTCDVGTGTASAHLKFYNGTVPTYADSTLAGNTVLADLTMTNTAFGNASDTNPGGTAAAATITDDSDADATGTCTFARIVNRDGTSAIQFTVGTSGAEINFNSFAIQQHARVQCTSLSVTLPEI
jgi:hypothetical protein